MGQQEVRCGDEVVTVCLEKEVVVGLCLMWLAFGGTLAQVDRARSVMLSLGGAVSQLRGTRLAPPRERSSAASNARCTKYVLCCTMPCLAPWKRARFSSASMQHVWPVA